MMGDSNSAAPVRITPPGSFLTVMRHPDRIEVVHTTDAVIVLVYVRDRDALLMIEEHRRPMVRPDNPEGKSTGFPAGRFDVALGVAELVVKELAEEAGVRITPDRVRILNDGRPLAPSPGVLTERLYLTMVEIDSGEMEADRIFGAPGEHEAIRRFLVPVAELPNFPYVTLSHWALVQWFLRERAGERR